VNLQTSAALPQAALDAWAQAQQLKSGLSRLRGRMRLQAHGSRAASTASGCRRSIIWSSRERKKSGVLIVKSPRNQATGISFSGDLGCKIHAGKRVFMRVCGDLQGRLDTLLRDLGLPDQEIDRRTLNMCIRTCQECWG
jgi:hypothetical protein